MTQMTKQGLQKWFERTEDALETLQNTTDARHLMQKHLVSRGFPDTEMNALRAALRVVEQELQSLQMAVYTDAGIPEIIV